MWRAARRLYLSCTKRLSRAYHRLIYVGRVRVAPSHLEHLAPVGLPILKGAHRLAREAMVRLHQRAEVGDRASDAEVVALGRDERHAVGVAQL